MLPLPTTLLSQLFLTMSLCEGQTTSYAIRAIAPDAALIAYDVAAEWCEEGEDGGEDKGVTKTILVTRFDLGEKETFKVDDDGRAEGRPAKEWPAFAKEHRVRQVGGARGLEATGCKGKLVAIRKSGVRPLAEASARPFQIVGYGVVLTTPDGVELPPMRLGATALAERDPSVAFAQLPGKQVLRAFIVNAKCEGGPPPGAFGGEDEGECYESYSRRKTDLTPKKFPGLEKCLKATAPPAGGSAP